MLDDPGDPLADTPQEAPRRPVVVVQVRRSLLPRLILPALLLIAAATVLSHRALVDDWRGLTSLFAEEPPPVDDRRVVRPEVAIAPAPSVLKVAPARSMAPTLKPKPIAMRPASGRARVAESPVSSRASKVEEAWAGIRRGVDEAKAKAVALGALKEKAADAVQVAQPAPVAPGVVPAVVLPQTAETRVAFRNDLRRALTKADGKAVAAAVEGVCETYGLRPMTDRPMGTALVAEMTGAGRRERVEQLRAKGMSESEIFGDLVRIEARNRVARAGPRSHHEVLIRAARQLLSVPLPKGSGASE